MGIKASKNNEEILMENKKYISDFNFKPDNDKKNKLIFTSIKNDESNNANESYNTNISITEELNKSTKMDSTFDHKLELVPVTFQWIDKNNDPNKELEVMITGTFLNNWNQCIKMEKNPETNIYEYKTWLPKEIHCFKYIVNNNWLCSELYKTTKDNSNNTNNYIDLRNYQNEENLSEKKTDYSIETKINKEKNGQKLKKKKKIKKIDEGYGLKYPLIKDLNITAPIILIHYKSPFLLNNQSNQDKFHNSFLYSNNNNYYNENNCFKEIFKFPHEKLGHITPNITDIMSNKTFYRYSTTERKKHKFLTLVYYKPK
jgi:hypothetical protein